VSKAGSAPGPAWRAIRALSVRELRLTLRRGESLLVTIVIPLAVLAFTAAVPLFGVPEPRLGWLLAGTIALAIVATSFVSLSIATAYERHYGVLRRLAAAPLPPGAVVIAKLVAVLAVELAASAMLIAVAAGVLGWRPSGAVSPGVVALAVALGTVTFGALGLVLASVVRAEATLALANGLFLVALLLGGVVVPVDALPEAIRGAASLLPVVPLAELLRAGLGLPGDASGAALALAAWAIVALLLAIRAFR
jgi:ABC-2 type transport system permease protein